jgi:hypothetical protein
VRTMGTEPVYDPSVVSNCCDRLNLMPNAQLAKIDGAELKLPEPDRRQKIKVDQESTVLVKQVWSGPHWAAEI